MSSSDVPPSFNSSFEELGLGPDDHASLAMDVARISGYQLAGMERNEAWQMLAEANSPVDLLGNDRWVDLARFTPGALDGLEIEFGWDDEGPFVSVDEMTRLGAVVLGQYLSGKAVN